MKAKQQMGNKNTDMSNIQNNWEIGEIENYLEDIIDYRGKTPKKAKSGIKTLSAKSIKNGRVDYNQVYFISEKTFVEWEKRGKPKVGDVLLTTEGPLGEVAQIDKQRVALAQRLIALRGKAKVLDNAYLKYFLMSPRGQHELLARATGTTVQGIKQSEFRKIKIIKPPFREQQSIAKILSDLDSKIMLNQHMNGTLEAVGEAVFRRWFIDFEFPDENGKPYKSSGGKMVKSKIGLIPYDWKIIELKEITIIDKTTINPQEFTNDVFSYYSFPAYDENRFPVLSIGQEIKSQKYLVDNDCVLVSRLNPVTKRVWLPYVKKNSKSICSTEFIIYKPKKQVSRVFIYCLVKNSEFQNFFKSLVTGSTGSRQRVPAKDSLNFKFAIPKDNDILQLFSKIVEPIFQMYNVNLVQNNILSKIQGLLLPKLMSGKIRVPVSDEVEV